MRFALLLATATLSCYSAVITSGHISTGRLNGTRHLTLNGDNFTIKGVYYEGVWGDCYGCAPGTMYDPFLLLGEILATATVDGVPLPSIDWNYIDALGGTSLIVHPDPVQLIGPGTYYGGTFTFNGTMCGYTTRTGPHPCDVLFPSLTGSGTYTLNAIAAVPPNYDRLQVTDVLFTFGVPEPASAGTTAAGLLALAAAIRHQKRRNN